MYIEKAIAEMKQIFQDISYGINHTLKVLENAEIIMQCEGVQGTDRERIALTAILHDIGAIEAQKKYGSMAGQYQEVEGPAIARGILERIGYKAEGIERICFIIANHHTPSKIDGLDFQILWEADLLESLPFMEISKNKEDLKQYIDENYKTAAGRAMTYKRLNLRDHTVV